MDEYVKIVAQFGYSTVELDLGKVYLQRGLNNRCVFQQYWGGVWICGLQTIKPLACKLYPFRVQKEPKYSGENNAYYNYKGTALYVYLDPHCPGIKFGTPSWDLLKRVLPEVVEIGLGVRTKQYYSTSQKISSYFRT